MKILRWIVLIVVLLGSPWLVSFSTQATVNEVTAANRYTGNGSTTVFAYTFKVLTKTDIEVSVDGTIKTVDTDYTVSGLGASGGGSVTFTTAPANATTVTLIRKQPLSQGSVYTPNEAFPSTRIEKDLDRLAMQIQMLQEQLNRSLHVGRQSTLSSTQTTLPETSCASKYLRWNATTNGFECLGLTATGSVTIPISPNDGGTGLSNTTGYTLAGLPAAGTAGRLARVTDNVRGLWRDSGSQWAPLSSRTINIKDFGAKGDGITNDTAAFNDAVAALSNYSNPGNPTAGGTAAAPTGGTILVPVGTYVINTTVVVNPYIEIVSQSLWFMGHAEAGFFGVSIFNNVSGGPAFKLKAGAAIRGMRFLKNEATADEHVRIVAEFCAVTNNTFGDALKHVTMVNETANVDAVHAHIAYNTFFHLNHATNASLSFSGANPAPSGSDSVIEHNNWHTHAALGYLGTKAIAGDGTNIVGGLKIIGNIFQNFAPAASGVVDLTSMRNAVVIGNNWGGITGASQDNITVGNGAHVIKGNAFAATSGRGIHLLATAKESEIGINDYSGGVTTAILIDNGAVRNFINEPTAGITITNNATGVNTIITQDRHSLGNNYYLRGQAAGSAVTLGLIGMSNVDNVEIAGDGSRTRLNGRTVMNAKNFAYARVAPTYGTTVTIDGGLGNQYEITATNGTAFTISNPSGNFENGQRITVMVKNASGGALGAITWGANYKMAAWTNPANTFNRSIDFVYDGTNWNQVSQTGVDVPN